MEDDVVVRVGDAVEGRGDLDEGRVMREGVGLGAVGDDGDVAVGTDVVDWKGSARMGM